MANALTDNHAPSESRADLRRMLGMSIVRNIPGGRQTISWLGIVAMVAFIFGAPALAFYGYEKFPFDPSVTDMVAAADPSYVFIGNSMLDSRIDADHLASLENGKTAVVLAAGGDMSAIWYLRLKNQVIKAGVQPEAVLILFRNDNLTRPVKNVTGKSSLKIQRFSTDEEPVVSSVFSQNFSVRQKISERIENFYPISTYHGYAVQTISRLSATPQLPNLFRLSLMRLIRPGTKTQSDYLAQMDSYSELKRNTREHLGYANIRDTSLTIQHPPTPPEFEHIVDTSFLPHIIALGKESGIPLVFVRVQQYGVATGDIVADEQMNGYLADLRSYIEAGGNHYYDLNGDPAIVPEFYSDGDHIHPDLMPQYTEIFHDRLSAVFSPKNPTR